MQFRIADTFTGSLARLTGDEQKAVKTAAFDLQMNPSAPGFSFHKLDRARDKDFWSVRVTRDIRLIVHKTADNLLLCYVDHHDAAYRWAERRRLERHPRTGAAQLVEIRETVREIEVPRYVDAGAPVAKTPDAPSAPMPAEPKPPIFADTSDEVLLSYGIPVDWLDDVRNANEDDLLDIAEHLPGEAAEALLELAVGGIPVSGQPAASTYAFESSDAHEPADVAGEPDDEAPEAAGADDVADPFEHPDAQRRFRIVHDTDELERALEYPWDKWAIFLHPAQRQIVEINHVGPFRVSGSAGTGKSVVAMHRAVFLAENNPDARILLTTFSDTLSNDLRAKLRRLVHNRPRLADQLEVDAIDTVGERLYRAEFEAPRIAGRDVIEKLMSEAADQTKPAEFSHRFLMDEWENVVDAWQLNSWESYRDVRRLGRKTRLSVERRATLWGLFERVNAGLRDRGLITRANMYGVLASNLEERRNPPFDFVVVDEAQDVSVAQLRFLTALGARQTNGLFFAGDLGQRIFQTPFSWKALGVDVRGRSQVLRLNYRTSHQIRVQADRLLEPEIADVDGNVEDRGGTVSSFSGEQPEMNVLETEQEESKAVGRWLRKRLEEGVAPEEIGVFVRSVRQLDRARDAASNAGLTFQILDEGLETARDHVSISTMHRAKGLEFRAVAVIACDDEVIPLQERIESVSDESDLKDVYDTERHLLYVACTRARDHLLITGVAPASEFLDDISAKD